MIKLWENENYSIKIFCGDTYKIDVVIKIDLKFVWIAIFENIVF